MSEIVRVPVDLADSTYFRLLELAEYKQHAASEVVEKAINELYISTKKQEGGELIEHGIVTNRYTMSEGYTLPELVASRPGLNYSTVKEAASRGKFPAFYTRRGRRRSYRVPISPEFLAWEEKVKAEPRGKGRSKNVNA